MKKSTNWITIPDETLHTPASKAKGKSKKQGKKSESVTNKLLWGIGFVVMAVIVFAVLSPSQFNDLLKGNLFDAEGVGSPVSNPSDLLAPVDGAEGEDEGDLDGAEGEGEGEEDGAEGEGEGEGEEDGAEEEGESEDEDPVEDEGYVSEPVVQPEEDAVTITIDPIVEPEDVDVEMVDGGEGEGEGEADAAEDPQAKLVEELSKQLEQLQKQREEDIKAMQELADVTKPSAPEGVPPSVGATSTLGQPPAVQPGFRSNTHTVTVTPEEMLRRNMAGGYQVAQQSTTQPVYQPAYQVSTPPAVQTPDTGPSEVMLIAFLLTFVSLLGWKLIRLSLA